MNTLVALGAIAAVVGTAILTWAVFTTPGQKGKYVAMTKQDPETNPVNEASSSGPGETGNPYQPFDS